MQMPPSGYSYAMAGTTMQRSRTNRAIGALDTGLRSAASPSQPRSLRTGAMRACCVLGCMLLAACGNGALGDAQQQAIATLGKDLPAPYRDGLIVDAVHRHGDDLVYAIRFPDATVAMAQAKPELFAALQLDEQQAMTELCSVPALAPVLAAGGGVRRRFIDANGAQFFEVALKASDCGSQPMPPQELTP
jgi:hypothetical protein